MSTLKPIYFEEKERLLNKNYQKYLENNFKQLQEAYQQAYEDIEKEIAQWYVEKMPNITNPQFRFSELKNLEDLKMQIRLILDELATVEEALLTSSIKELYISDYIDFHELNKKYKLEQTNTPLPAFNSLKAPQVLETYVNLPKIRPTVAELADLIEVNFVSDAISGRWFNTRIRERADKLNYSIEERLRQAIIRGESYSKTASAISDELSASYNSAKTLVRTEMALTENKAVIHNCMKLGYNGLEWSCYKDDRACKVCQELNGTLFKVDEVRAKDLLPHPNCRCTMIEVMLNEDGTKKKSKYYNKAKEYMEQKAKETNERINKQYADFKNVKTLKNKYLL